MKLSEVLEKLEVERAEGDGWLAKCPAHADGRPSLLINLTENGKVLLYCRAGCEYTAILDAAGLTSAQLADVENDVGAVQLSGSHRPTVTGGDVAKLGVYLSEVGKVFAGSLAEHYAMARFGLSPERTEMAGLGFDAGGSTHGFESTGLTWRAHPRLVVPFMDFNGVPRGAQGRDLSGDDTMRWCSLTNPSDAEWSKLAVFDAGNGLDTWVITEGPGDALTCFGAGFNAVAIRGAALANNARLKSELVHALVGCRVVVAGDADRAGREFAQRLAGDLAAEGIDAVVLSLPEGINDVSDWYEAHNETFIEDFGAAARDAVPPTSAPPTQRIGSAGDPDAFTLDDAGNAQRLVESFKGDLRYTKEFGWMLYIGGVWVVDHFDSVKTAAIAVTDTLMSEADALLADGRTDSEKERGKRLKQHAIRSRNNARIDAMVDLARALPGVPLDVDKLDRHHHLLAVANGVVDLRTGVLLPHDRALLLTRRVDVDYHEDAKAPRWEQFLSEVFNGSTEMVEYMQRLVGYGITGYTTEQCFAILWGRGANGKSVFTDTLAHVFGAVTNVTPFSTFEVKRGGGGIPNDIAALKGSRLVFASEGDQGVPMSESTLKRVTGQDLISARFMRKEFFSFHPTFLIMMATNFKPNFKGQDEGLWRRVKLIPWTRYFKPEERDHHLTQKLKDEAEGILTWAVMGALEWYMDGLQDPPAVVNATEDYRGTSDALDGFFPGIYERVTGGQIIPAVKAPEMYKRYKKWCEDEELPLKEWWSRRAFYAAMEERGLARKKRSDTTYFVGVALAAPEKDTDAGPVTLGLTHNGSNRLNNLETTS